MAQISTTNKKFYWTEHAKEKIKFYQLSANRLKRVLRHPNRVEEGIAEETIACMQVAGSKKHPYEIWLMYQIKPEQITIISAWRYPGTTKPGDIIPIPENIRDELKIN